MAGQGERYEHPLFMVLVFALIILALVATALDPTGLAARIDGEINAMTLTGTDLAMFVAGLVLVISGVAIRFAAVGALGRNFSGALRIRDGHTLVTTGIYRPIRHPAYLGAALLFAGIPIMFSSILGLFAMLLLVACLVYRIRSEERMLIDRFGDEYLEYMGRSKRLIPFVY